MPADGRREPPCHGPVSNPPICYTHLMGLPNEQSSGFTYADYLTWPEGERWELIEGVAYSMSPAPTRSHQRILLHLARVIGAITDAGPCETYLAPFDVRLREPAPHPAAGSADEATTTVVQPDISVFCDPSVLDERGADGAPDLVVEIASPSTMYKDQTQKLTLYERHGVREYWIVNGEARWVMVYRLGADGRYGKPDYYRAGHNDEQIESAVLGQNIGVDAFL